MAYSKLTKILFVLLCIFIILFPFALITKTFATELDENVEYSVVNDLVISANSNVFQNAGSNSYSIGYLELDSNYIYTIQGLDVAMTVATSNVVPAVQETYNYITTVPTGESFTFRGDGYLYLCFRSNYSGTKPTVTRRPVESMNTTIAGLVDNVGINSIWSIFDISINYIVIVVLVAFGIFIITRIIKKISKGKEGL